MTLAHRLKRVSGIDIETCPTCTGTARSIACIGDAEVTERFPLNSCGYSLLFVVIHLGLKTSSNRGVRCH